MILESTRPLLTQSLFQRDSIHRDGPIDQCYAVDSAGKFRKVSRARRSTFMVVLVAGVFFSEILWIHCLLTELTNSFVLWELFLAVCIEDRENVVFIDSCRGLSILHNSG